VTGLNSAASTNKLRVCFESVVVIKMLAMCDITNFLNFLLKYLSTILFVKLQQLFNQLYLDRYKKQIVYVRKVDVPPRN